MNGCSQVNTMHIIAYTYMIDIDKISQMVKRPQNRLILESLILRSFFVFAIQIGQLHTFSDKNQQKPTKTNNENQQEIK